MIKGFGGIFWRTAENDSYFPTEQQEMLNFQVHNLNETIKHLEHVGVPLAKKKEIREFDFENNRIVYHRGYYFCKEMLLEAGKTLGVPVQLQKAPNLDWREKR